MATDNEPTADGGETTHPLFEGELDSTVTRSQRAYRAFDRYVYAPFAVAWHDSRSRVGAAIILGFVLMGTVGVVLIPAPEFGEGPQYLGAFQNMEYPLGTTKFGEDVFEQIVHATPAMLKLALAGAVAATAAAVLIGTASGYKGGVVDRVLMTLTDIVLTIPGLPLIILLTAIFEPTDPFVVGMLLAIDNWPGLARSVRSQVLTIREESYTEAGRAMGLRSTTILRNDVTPQLMPYILINAAQSARGVIFESVGLYFLGILPFNSLNWGVMMNRAHQNGALANLQHGGSWLLAPMVVLVAFSFGFVLLSQGMDRIFNPRLRARHAKTVSAEEDIEGT